MPESQLFLLTEKRHLLLFTINRNSLRFSPFLSIVRKKYLSSKPFYIIFTRLNGQQFFVRKIETRSRKQITK